MNIFKKKNPPDSVILGSPTRAGCPKRVLQVFRFDDGRLWNVLGTVSPGGREVFVVWDARGHAYVCHERERKFDLLIPDQRENKTRHDRRHLH
ncbi:MAG: hypothetical protein LBP56_00230 [Odoribacteraceae bacterium]|nr:hypothetical protein [Odoribacteraceae bacterium]